MKQNDQVVLWSIPPTDPYMNRFCSWGGGKDSCLARFRAKQSGEPLPLLTMVVEGSENDHHEYASAVTQQAKSLETSIYTEEVTWGTYEDRFKRAVSTLDANAGVFGTIDVDEHRSWVESTCAAAGVTPEFPLWGDDPVELFHEILDRGWEAIVVKLDATVVDESWLGKPLDAEFLDYSIDNEIHPMGEGGEYQTLVVDGPGFTRRLPVETCCSRTSGNYRVAQLDVSEPGVSD